MRIQPRLYRHTLGLATLFAATLATTAVEAAVLFELVVDPSSPTPFSDATGRHTLVADGVAAGPPGVPAGGGTVVATNVLSPDGRRAALFTAGWLEILSTPATENDFLFAEDQNLTIEFWFRSAGNGAYDDDPGNPDRMHAIGFGDTANNLDVDLGDNDLAPPASQETALWTYFGSDGEIAITDPRIDRSFYLDDAWHRYSLVRTGNLVTVYLDGAIVGTAAYSGPLGSASASAQNFIGRASLLTEMAIMGPPGFFPWFGYISGVRVFDEALPPPTSVPSLAPVAAIALVGLMVGIAWTRLRPGAAALGLRD